MDALIVNMLIVILPIALCVFAYYKHMMTFGGAIAAFILSEIIGFSANIHWMLCFFLFPAMAFLATKYRFEDKVKMGLQEGKRGERGLFNILGVGVIPAVISLVYCLSSKCGAELTVAYLSALAVSTADTVASELGPLAKTTYMITTLKKIEPGPNGGISVYGMVTSTLAAAIFGCIGWIMVFGVQTFDVKFLCFLIVPAAGLFGNIMDSLIGALLENPGYVNKYVNNCSTSLMGAVFGFLLALILL